MQYSKQFQTLYHIMAAGAVIGLVPVIVVFIFLQRYFIQGPDRRRDQGLTTITDEWGRDEEPGLWLEPGFFAPVDHAPSRTGGSEASLPRSGCCPPQPPPPGIRADTSPAGS